MDIQLKRGLLDVCVLAAIKQEDSYGYKIIKDLSDYIKLSEAVCGAFRIDPIPHSAKIGGRTAALGAFCRAQRPAAQVLPHHGTGAKAA